MSTRNNEWLHPTYDKPITLSWEDVTYGCRTLVNEVEGRRKRKGMPRYEGILAIARGGTIPGILIAGMLGIRPFRTMQLASYTDAEIGEIKLVDNPPLVNSRWLIVDDIVGTGATLNYVKKHYPNNDFCTLVIRHELIGQAMSGIFLGPKAGWVIFPWETVREIEGVIS